MELRSCVHLHFIQAIQGGSIVKILNVTRGRPSLSFKKVTDIYGNSMFDNNVKVERSCISEVERRTVKTEYDIDACSADDGDDEENVLEDCNFGNLTLRQIQERCKAKKRKHSQGLHTSKRKIKTEASSCEENCIESHTASDDSEFMETLSSWRSKLSKNKMAKKRKCIKDQVSSITQEIISPVKSEVIQSSQESLSDAEVPEKYEVIQNSENSAALVEVKVEVPESDWSDPWRMLYNTSNNFQACCWPENYLGIVAIEEPEIARECVLGCELDYECKEHADVAPLQIVWDPNTDVFISDSKLSDDQSQNFPAIDFKNEESEKCVMQPHLHSISPQTINLDEDENTDVDSNKPDSHIAVMPLIASEDIHCVDLGKASTDAFFSDCSKGEYISVSEHDCNPNGSRNCGSNGSPDESEDCCSDDSPVSEEKQFLASTNFDEERHASEATDKPISWESHQSSTKVHHPQRLLSGRKTISPSSQIELCKAMQSIDLHNKEHATCQGKLFFGEQIDDEKKDTTEELVIVGARFTKHCNKLRKIPKPLKRVSHPQGIQTSSLPSRSASRLSTGLTVTSMQSCAKNAISFSKRQMYDAECLAMKLTNELKSMKDIMAAMFRSELCLTTPLRYKVNEARMALKKARRAEENAKRTLSFMARDCNRFCRLMQLADEGSSPVKDVVRNNSNNKSKKIAFADEAGGRLCQVRFYENDGALVESDRNNILL